VLEAELTLRMREMVVSFCRPWVVLELARSVLARDFTISTTNTLNGNHTLMISSNVADLSLFLEGEVARLIVVNDQHSCSAVSLEKCVTIL
jgi:hypothetical protein